MMAAAVSWALVGSSLRQPPAPPTRSSRPCTRWRRAALFLMLGAVALGEPGQLDGGSFTAASVSAWFYLVVAGSLVGFSAYAWLLRAPISLVVTHQYVNPLVAIALGMLPRRAAEPVDARRRLRRRRRRLRGDPQSRLGRVALRRAARPRADRTA